MTSFALMLEYHEAGVTDDDGCSWAFWRSETRRTRLKRGPLDCGHVIDSSEPYRYSVGKMVGATVLFQRLDCEFCARVDARY